MGEPSLRTDLIISRRETAEGVHYADAEKLQPFVEQLRRLGLLAADRPGYYLLSDFLEVPNLRHDRSDT